MKKHRKKIIITVYLAILLILQEVVFSWCFPLPEIANINRSFYTPTPSNVAPWKPIRFETLSYTSAPDTFSSYHYLNAYGFSNEQWTTEKPEGKKRILFVGDSFVEGLMTTPSQNIPSAFEAVAGYDKVEVMNAGVAGAGLPEYANLIHAMVPTFKPDVVILVLFANDIGTREAFLPDSIFVPQYTNPYIPRLAEVVRRLSNQEKSGFRWGPERMLNPPVPDPANHWTLKYNEYAPHVDPEIVKHMQNGHFNIWRINYLKFEEVGLRRWVDLKPFVQQVSDYTKQHHAELMICYIPSRNQLTRHYLPYDLLSCKILCSDTIDLTQERYQVHRKHLDTICREMKIPYLDFTPNLAAAEQNGHHQYWRYDDHFLPATYVWAGEEIGRFWMRR